MPPSISPTAPEAPRRTNVTVDRLADQLWRKVVAAAGSVEIGDTCERMLHEIVQRGSERMFSARRTTPKDIALAEKNIDHLVFLMKRHAELLGHAARLGEDTLRDATRELKAAHFELWPFWPW